jgi:hypothetical protein
MLLPWAEVGVRCVLIDPQHEGWEVVPVGDQGGAFYKVPLPLEEATSFLERLIEAENIVFGAAFPPCTNLASSGSAHWKEKRQARPAFQRHAAEFARRCGDWLHKTGAPWMVENPVGRLSTLWRKPDHTFHPYEFTGFEPRDNYFKTTCLWTGNGFRMPPEFRDQSLGPPDHRIHKAGIPAGGSELDRKNFRSATPLGFARAVFRVNYEGRGQGSPQREAP